MPTLFVKGKICFREDRMEGTKTVVEVSVFGKNWCLTVDDLVQVDVGDVEFVGPDP